MTERLREELRRIGETAPVAHVDPATWGRARRARTRDRALVAAAVVAVLALVGGLAGVLPSRHSTPVAGGSQPGVPDHIWSVPERMQTRNNDGSWMRSEVTGDVAVGRAAAAYVSADGLPVVVGANDGAYHLLDLPDFAGNNALVARGLHGDELALQLSPDGRRLAYTYARFGPAAATEPIPSGVRVLDLASGAIREIPVSGGEGTVVSSIGWSPGSSWVVWSGWQEASWTKHSMGGSSPVAGLIAPDATTSTPLPAFGNNARASFAVSDVGEVTIVGDSERYVASGGEPGRRIPLHVGESFSVGASYLGSTLRDLRGRDTAYRYRLDTYAPAHERVALPPQLLHRGVAPLGWIDETHLLARVGAAEDAATGVNLQDLAVIGTGADASYRVVGRVELGVPNLSVATDLMTLDLPTVERPEPDWPWSTDRIAWTIGLGVAGALALILAARALWRHTRHL